MARGQTGNYRGSTPAERAAERRIRLLDATLEVWADPTVRTTMTAVCASAKLSERYFYESFPTLLDAQRAVLGVIASDIEADAVAAADAAGSRRDERIRAALAAFVRSMVDDPRKARVAIVEAGAIAELRPRRTELLRHFAELATEYAGDRTDSSSDRVAGLLFVGGLAEVVTAWIDGALEPPLDGVVDAATRMYSSLYSGPAE